jgi:hypothetical protein
MKKSAYLGVVFLCAVGLSCAVPKARTFTGEISDSMCGLKHMMPGGAKACTDECVKAGAKYILADAAHNKVYQLSDQDKPKEFSGEKVKVTGMLNGDTIEVTSVEADKR